jgi:hypothetical protein
MAQSLAQQLPQNILGAGVNNTHISHQLRLPTSHDLKLGAQSPKLAMVPDARADNSSAT